MSDIHKGGTSKSGDSKNIGLVLGVFVLGFFAGFIVSILTSNRNVSKQPQEVAHIGEESAKVDCGPTSSTIDHKKDSVESSKEEGSTSNSHNLVITKAQRDQMMSLDFLALLHDAEIHKYRYEGETRGIKITKIRSGSIFERAGLQNEDIIEQINGIAIAEFEKNPKLPTAELPAASKVTLKVRRGEKVISIRIVIAGY